MEKKPIEKYVRVNDAGEGSSSNFVNYAVKKKPDAELKKKRALYIVGYVAFGLLYACLFLGLIPGVKVKLPLYIAFLPVIELMVIYFTWWYVNVECEYYIFEGEMRFLEVYGSKKMRELCRVRVSAMTRIAPYNDEYKGEVAGIPEENRCWCISSPDSPDLYFGIFKDKNGTECAVFFEATEKTLKVMKYYNSEAVVLSKTRY